MINTQYINLNMIPSGVMPVLYCSQYDVGRPLGMVVYNGGEAVDLDTYTCTIEATRTDGTAITSAVTTSDNIGVFVTTATMTNQADKYPAKLVLFDSNSRRVASLAFILCVTPKTMDENAESIQEDESLYQQFTGTVQTLIADIREDVNAKYNELLAHTSWYVTPEEYGAYGDGVHDDTTAFQNAINATQTGKILLCRFKAEYLVSHVTITSSCMIEGNLATLKAFGTAAVMVVTAATTGYHGYIKYLRIDCDNKAESGIEITQNINTFRFSHINIRNVVTNGIYGHGGGGEFSDITIYGDTQTGVVSKGVYMTAPDSVWDNLMVVNCKYGAYFTAMAHLSNFHPWNSYAELMTTSVGIYSNSTVYITNSYIDTCAICFDGTGVFMVNGCNLFWSTEYYTDATAGASTHPYIVGQNVFIRMTGVRSYPCRGKTDQLIFFCETPGTAKPLINDVTQYNQLESVARIPRVGYSTPTITYQNGAQNAVSTPIRRYSGIVEMHMDITGVALSKDFTIICTLPAGYRPTYAMMIPMTIGATATFARYNGCLRIDTNGNMFIKCMDDIAAAQDPTALHSLIHTEFRTPNVYELA